MIYSPREDSFLIQKHIKEFCKPSQSSSSFSVLDMGTGSGMLALEATKYCKKVTASDIDKEVIQHLKKDRHSKLNYKKGCCQRITLSKKTKKNIDNISFIHSDLFQKIPDKFDLIIFNPPYLPSKPINKLLGNKTSQNSQDIKKSFNNSYVDIALDGGKNGTEIIERFLKEAKKHLKKDGKILLLTSSLNKNIEKFFKKQKYHYKLLEEEKFFFEKLFIWVLT
jgi:release factor glutamine methyltransferase